MEISLESEIDSLFSSAMKGDWHNVAKIYERSPEARRAKLTKSEDTALHIAVSVGQTETAMRLVDILSNENNSNVLKIKNAKGNTVLHVAAALGHVSVCKSINDASKSGAYDLLAGRNLRGETPLFLAARHGKKEAFLFLHKLGRIEDSHARRNDGDTILHAAIIGEYFSLAMSIIHSHPELVDAINENGLSPLHIMARQPNAFRSTCRLGLFDRIIYYCLVLPKGDLMEEVDDIDAYIEKRSKKETTEIHNYPKNYKTIVTFCRMLLPKVKKEDGNKTNDEENQQQKSAQEEKHLQSQRRQARYFPPNYNNLFVFVNFVIKAFLIILGIGILRIDKIRKKKKLHKWAKLVMDELVMNTSTYKFYDRTGLNPYQTRAGKADKSFGIEEDFGLSFEEHYTNDSDFEAVKNILRTNPSFKYEHLDQNKAEGNKQQTPILIAAKMGVTEMVEKILKEFPVAIQDSDSDGKNVVLLAVENRHSQIYNLLLKSKIPKESVFKQLDKNGNSALHLAAQYQENRPWLIPGVALQMQWEIKWYKYVKRSMPLHFFPRYNYNHQTPKDIFATSHKGLVKEGGKWLVKTAESCSVVAALVTTVAYATSATIPGGVDQQSGAPLLRDAPAFRAFALSSLVALCFSVTALVFFLSILTSRYQEKDFESDLPRKLLLGLTSLFASIASMLVSFCDGHVFILPENLRLFAYPLYAFLCFPVLYFALAQLSLYFDLVWAILRTIPQRSNKAFLN